MSILEVTKSGCKKWRNEEGQLHRVGWPAVIYPNGTESWYLHGRLHRVDGPAITNSYGRKYFYLNGEKLTKEDWFNRLPKEQRIKVVFRLDEL